MCLGSFSPSSTSSHIRMISDKTEQEHNDNFILEKNYIFIFPR